MDRVAAKLQGRQDKIYFLHDNVKSHIAKSRREKLLEPGWTVVPTDYRLFRSLAAHLREKVRGRTRLQNGPQELLQSKVPGLLQAWDPFSSRAFATDHRQ